MKRVMLDLETLGLNAGCVILSIGAVVFDEKTSSLGEKFYIEINQNSCTQVGLTVLDSTLDFWNGQPEEAKGVLRRTAGGGGNTLAFALHEFEMWLKSLEEEYEIWACGAAFDPPILEHAYHLLASDAPWKFWNVRCYRTLKGLFPQHKFTRAGTHHNALDDAISQAEHAMAILRAVLPREEVKPSLRLSIKNWLLRESRWMP